MEQTKRPTYLEVQVPFGPIAEIRQKIDAKIGKRLEHRGEAHITVLTPPEVKEITKAISMDEVDAFAVSESLQQSQFTQTCVGRYLKGSNETYFLVIDSPQLRAFRGKLRERLPDSVEFNSEVFFPHITIGFVGRDLHLSDGARKDASSCWIKLDSEQQ